MTRRASRHDPEKPIRSAETVAWCRALARREPAPPVACPDSLAHVFLNPILRALLRPRALWRWFVERRLPGLYHLHFGRTLYIDEALRQALGRGIDQLVLLGAGYDSRPYRLRDELSGVRIFEVDFPGTQERKKTKLRRHLGALPDHVTFVPIDFECQSLDEVLRDAGYDTAARTFFVWEGVCCFLTAEAVDDVMGFVRRGSAPGSRIVFDLWDRQAIDGDDSTFGAERLVATCKRLREPLLWGLHRDRSDEGDGADELPAWLADRGLRRVDAATTAEMEARWFGSDPHRRMVECFRMVTAEVTAEETAEVTAEVPT